MFNISGYQYGEATKVAWLEYVSLIVNWMYSIFLFDDTPDVYEIIGVTILVIACCIIPLSKEFYEYYTKHYNYNGTGDNDSDSDSEEESDINKDQFDSWYERSNNTNASETTPLKGNSSSNSKCESRNEAEARTSSV